MNINDFKDVEYINLITYKNDGSSVTTPVWVAPHDNSLVVTTSLNAGKVKRVRSNNICNKPKWYKKTFKEHGRERIINS